MHVGAYFNNPNKIDVQDCVSDQFYNYFRSVSAQNTKVYDDVFKCLPSDNIKTFEILASYADQQCLSKTDPNKVNFNKISILIYYSNFTKKRPKMNWKKK